LLAGDIQHQTQGDFCVTLRQSHLQGVGFNSSARISIPSSANFVRRAREIKAKGAKRLVGTRRAQLLLIGAAR
jgi:hypothetical protein